MKRYIGIILVSAIAMVLSVGCFNPSSVVITPAQLTTVWVDAQASALDNIDKNGYWSSITEFKRIKGKEIGYSFVLKKQINYIVTDSKPGMQMTIDAPDSPENYKDVIALLNMGEYASTDELSKIISATESPTSIEKERPNGTKVRVTVTKSNGRVVCTAVLDYSGLK